MYDCLSKKPEFGPGLIVSDKGFSNCKENYYLNLTQLSKLNLNK